MKQNIMIQGTMSSAGKSLICAALCRIFTQDGFKTAPFKSQNMALNSFITEDGAEMGRAQVMQAEAAKIRPDARMNPILLKPTSDVGSQVIVNGHVLGNMPAASYFKYKKQLVPEIMKAYRSLEEEYDIIVIEGAGSPAEINLKKNDIVNMGMAKMVDAPVLLAGDIDRGGVFAQLYGTVALLEEEEIDVIVSSDLARSYDTAMAVARRKGLEPVRTPLLREMDWGIYTGKVANEMDFKNLPESVESVEALYKRAGEFLQFLQTNFPGKRILAIGHGGFNRAIIVRIEKRQQEEILKLPIMKNTACLRFSL